MAVFDINEGQGAVILAQPHGGTCVPDDLQARLNDCGRALADTDWHITRLYDGLLDNVTVVRSNIHRYVIDANRDPLGVSLYPGQNTTSLCPTTDFEGRDIWQEGQVASKDEIEQRRADFHAPYHRALAAQIERVKALHGVAIVYDCHSIRARIPFLFEGELPVFNVGTNRGETCAQNVEAAVWDVCIKSAPMKSVLNGRFRGGWTTRHYGQPENGVHAIQMELTQAAYMNEFAPWEYRDDRADRLRPILKEILVSLDRFARSGNLALKGNINV